MKNNFKKFISLFICAALLLSGIGATVYAVNNEKKDENKVLTQAVDSNQNSTISKDETVYVLAGADGTVQKVIVSDWIKNSLGSSEINDKSNLTDVENVKSDETYTMNSENMRVWDAQGNDIYYQGNIEKELPVNINVSYKLDGRSISPSELAEKSGHVTIRFEYNNNQYEMVEIDGKQEKMYVPFAMLTGILLDNNIFRNVDISNGKLINDGNRTAVVGIAFPGLQDNLGIDSQKFKVPNYVEISADVENFELMNTVTIATNEIFSNLDSEKLNSADELTNSINELTSAMKQLTDGSSRLYNGMCTLLDKSGQLVDGINKLAEGAYKLKNGSETLDKGAGELNNGAKELASGLEKLESNNSALTSGSKQVFDSLLSMANSQISSAGLNVPKLTIENYAKVLNDVIISLDETNVAKQAQATALETVTNKVNSQKDTIKSVVTSSVREEITSKVTESVRAGVETQVLASMNMTKEDYDKGIAAGIISSEQQAQVISAVNEQMSTESVKTMIDTNVESQMNSSDIQTLIDSKTAEQIKILIEQNMNSAEVQGQITSALEKAKSGAASISALKEQLDSYNTFYMGLENYTEGVSAAKNGADSLSSGTNELKNGTSELHAGMNELYDGILVLKDGAPALIDGVSELRDGAMKLSDGLKEFNEKGVQKLTNAVNGDLRGLLTRLKATVDVSKKYKSFSGISDNMDGQVKFIYRTDSIELK